MSKKGGGGRLPRHTPTTRSHTGRGKGGGVHLTDDEREALASLSEARAQLKEKKERKQLEKSVHAAMNKVLKGGKLFDSDDDSESEESDGSLNLGGLLGQLAGGEGVKKSKKQKKSQAGQKGAKKAKKEEEGTVDCDALQAELEALRAKQTGTDAELKHLKSQLQSAQPEGTPSHEALKAIMAAAMQTGKAATPKKEPAPGSGEPDNPAVPDPGRAYPCLLFDGIISDEDSEEDGYNPPHATPERVDQVINNMDGFLYSANSRKEFTLGITIQPRKSSKVNSFLKGITQGWVKWHIFEAQQMEKLTALHKKWLPQSSAQTPETMFNAMMRAMLSRHVKPHPSDIGVDMEGRPVDAAGSE